MRAGAGAISLKIGLVVAFVVFGITVARAEMPARPHRVVSLDDCADEYVLGLADRDQIAAVTSVATREFSYYAARARGLPTSGASVEEVLKLNPDLVVRFVGGGYEATEMLSRFGIPVLNLADSASFEAVRENTRRVGAALGQPARAEATIAGMDRRLAEAARIGAASPRPRAIYVTPGGATAGRGTMVDAVLRAAGVINGAAAEGTRGWVHIDLETLVLDPPQLIVASFFDHATVRTDHWTLASNSVLRRMMRERPTVVLPSRLMSCGGPYSVEAVERIRSELLAMYAEGL